VSLIVSLILTVILIPVVMRYRILDRPNYRSIHTRETPKAGGLAIFAGILGGLLASGHLNDYALPALLMAGATALGLLDDLKNLPPGMKLLGQAVLALVTIAGGYRFFLFGHLPDGILTALWIVGFMNAFNLIDGMDGLAGGVAAIAALVFLGLGIPGLEGLILPLLGALLGFLVFNFRPAKIFMGDTGSMLLGFLLALLGISAQQHAASPWVGAAVMLLILAYPIFDTALSIVRRRVHRRPVFAPDRSHSYNLLMDHVGLSYLGTVFTVYAVTALFGLCALVVYASQSPVLAFVGVVAVVALLIAGVRRYNLLAESRYERARR